MCGIVAILSDGEPVDAGSVERATRALHHRGPDARHCWIDEEARIGLGHARLSIIDLSTGDQPLANEDATIHAVVNGELYDFERIRRELEDKGHRFATRSDSEILLHLYEDLGLGCMEHLRGEFAFVLWDSRRRILVAGRDRFGIKPLFYAQRGGKLLFASEAKALFAAGVPARWDHESFFDANSLVVPRQDRTLFASVRQVPPGHLLVASGSRVEIQRYWDFDYPLADAVDERSDAECAELLRDALDEAVRLRLRADVPVGCYLSGGIDSCAVLGLASRHRIKPIRTFTLRFDRAEYDEGPIAREMADKVGAEFQPIALAQADLAEHFADAIWHGETLCLNAHGVAKFVLSRAVREAGYKVVLTGEGSDEILGGYPPFRRDMLLYDSAGQEPQVVARLLAELDSANPLSHGLLLPDGNSLPAGRVKTALGFVPSWMEAYGSTGRKMHALFSDQYLRLMAGRDSFGGLIDHIDVAGQLAGRSPVHQSLYLWAKTQLVNYVLTMLGDRMEMAHSVEGRVPFLDHHVVELVRSLPVRQKIRGTVEKYVLREAARPVLTETVYARHKHPFTSPPVALAPDGKLHELLQETLRGQALESLPFYDRGKVVGLLDRLPAMSVAERTAIDPALMMLLSACTIQQRFRPSA
ncbi:MAG TPA: asparagine synthase (glutamine-hydrolyzing) [Candidatus Binatia bacterium]|jgi:asparagine synthase (glutamine-hydrolysing)